MKKSDILVFDTEHGGFVPDATLLEVYFGVFGDSDEPKGELHMFLQPDDGAYVVTSEAMAVNKIDIAKHGKKAITYSEGSKLLRDFLYKHSDGGKQRLDPLGHNVAGDVRIVVDRLLKGSNNKWTQYVNYRQLDTATIFAFLKRKGVVPSHLHGGVGELSKHFNVDVIADHTAKADAIATLQVYKELEKI